MDKFLKFRNSDNDKDIYLPVDFILRFESDQIGTRIITNNGEDLGQDGYLLKIEPEKLIRRIYTERPGEFEIIPIGYNDTPTGPMDLNKMTA